MLIVKRAHAVRPYRVIKNKDMFEIHEVYYNKKGEIIGVTEDSVSPGGETLEELQEDMKHGKGGSRTAPTKKGLC